MSTPSKEAKDLAMKIQHMISKANQNREPAVIPGWESLGSLIDAEFAAMRKERDAIKNAANALVTRLQEIHDHPKYAAVWLSYQNHHGHYNGPQYDKELISLKEALAQASEKKV